MTSPIQVHLEPEAQAFVEATSKPPFWYELGPKKSRATLDNWQAAPVTKLAVATEELLIDTELGRGGQISLRILRPENTLQTLPLPVIVYVHGPGWLLGSNHTHDRPIREIVVGTGAVVIYPDYSLSPEARYPTALEEIYAVVKWVAGFGAEKGLDPKTLTLAGDSAGGNLVAAVTLLAKERGGPCIQRQLLFYPITDAAFDTDSYHQFAEGYYLRRDEMKWFWDQYTTNLYERNEITGSPLRASIEQLKGLPEALIITCEADVVRDEGEAYAGKLRAAGVRVMAVRFQGTIHDFVMLNSLANTAAARGAISLAIMWLQEGFNQKT